MTAPVSRAALRQIDVDDERFRITAGGPSPELVERVCRWGCLVPPICARVGGRLVPVAGFKRLAALRGSGSALQDAERQVEVRMLDEGLDALAIIATAARDTRRDRDLTPFECARAIRRALSSGIERSMVARQLLPELGLEPHETVIRRHLKLESIPAALVEHLAPQGVSLRRALRFVNVTDDQAELLVAVGRGLSLSLRSLEECASMLADVAARQGRSWHDVAAEAGLLEELAAKKRDPDRARAALKALFGLRYPTWHAASQRARELARAVDAPENVRLSWDHRFEKEGLELTVEARTVAELESKLTALLSKERLSRLAELFDNL